jgi:hypothetical protein
LSEVHAFLGTVGVMRIFIRNFAHRVHHLVKLTRKDVDFVRATLRSGPEGPILARENQS